MGPGLSLLLIVLAAFAMVALFFGLERWLKRPGLGFWLASASAVVGVASSLYTGARLQAALFALMAVSFAVSARERRRQVAADAAKRNPTAAEEPRNVRA